MRLAIALAILCTSAAAQDVSHFPYPVIMVPDNQAQVEWHRLRDEPGTPVIVGDAQTYHGLIATHDPALAEMYPSSTDDILSRTTDLTFPQAIHDLRRAEIKALQDQMREDDKNLRFDESYDLLTLPPHIDPGYFPVSTLMHFPPQSLAGIIDWSDGQPIDQVYIVILPTENPWEAPAYLRFGGWNDNPPAEIHVAALRRWYHDYGAEPAVINSEVIELWVPRPPTDRWHAYDLAIAQYHYGGAGWASIPLLAVNRMRAPYWYFWWD